jgi:hypothetical protein
MGPMLSGKRLQVSIVACFLLPTLAGAATSYTFRTTNNNGDPNFNQLLGINNSGKIAGYFGDATVVPNNGYTVTAPYGQADFTAENVSGATQTQVTAINNTGITVGFSVDGAGNNTGFTFNGTTFTTGIADPNTPTTAPTTNQLLGVNDHNLSVGFYVDSAGNAHGYTYNLSTSGFAPINPPGATSSTATGINSAGDISGFLTNSAGAMEGYYYNGSTFKDFSVPGSTGTAFFGLNNKGWAVGFYTDANGLTNGLVYNVLNGSWYTVNDPNASATAAFGVDGTTINGINDLGQLVGFYSDGTHVNGLLATPTPEPASLLLMGGGAAMLLAFRRKRA